MPERIQLSRSKGWRMPANTVKVDRTTEFGNPFAIQGEVDRAKAVSLFVGLLQEDTWQTPKGNWVSKSYVRGALHGKNLACWCPLGQACHADELLKLAN